MANERDLFTDRVVTIYVSLEAPRGTGMVMDHCTLRRIGQREFVVGIPVDVGHKGDRRWPIGVETAIALDSVASMHFMTRAQYEELLKRPR